MPGKTKARKQDKNQRIRRSGRRGPKAIGRRRTPRRNKGRKR